MAKTARQPRDGKTNRAKSGAGLAAPEHGTDASGTGRPQNRRRPATPGIPRLRDTTKALARGLRQGDRTVLARAITLIESNAPDHLLQAQDVLTRILPATGNSIRIGVTGIPGAGKSTLIEALGLHLLGLGHRVAVLAIDPSSSRSGGSILGDKTRMQELARAEHSFIRPSPSGGAPGGVARKTRESILLCEAAGFDVILVETVGVGQNEFAVRAMVDFFLLLQIPGSGDELQGLKRGVIEICDAVFINKAEGENKPRAEAARQDVALALRYLRPATPGWTTRAFTCSALTGDGIPALWRVVQKFKKITTANGTFATRRESQAVDWLHTLITEQLREHFLRDPAVKKRMAALEGAVRRGDVPVTAAVQQLLDPFFKNTD